MLISIDPRCPLPLTIAMLMLVKGRRYVLPCAKVAHKAVGAAPHLQRLLMATEGREHDV
jgi:hypothetical protein